MTNRDTGTGTRDEVWDGPALHTALGDYLHVRRGLGYDLARPEKLLASSSTSRPNASPPA